MTIGLVLSFFWLIALRSCARNIVQMSLGLMVVMPFVMAVVCFIQGQIIGALICLLFTCLSACYWAAVQSRIPLAVAMLEVASTFIQNSFSIIGAALLMLVTMIGFLCVWGMSMYCTLMSMGALHQTESGATNDNQVQNKAGLGVMAYFFMAFFWGTSVLANTLHVTTSGAFASWFMGNTNGMGVGASMCRALTTSFGAICYGSFLISVIRTLKALVREDANENGGDDNALMCFVRCCVMCILSCIEDIMDFINYYAYVHVAINNADFCSGASSTWTLLCSSGWTLVINQDITNTALVISSLVVGAVGGFATYLVALVGLANESTAIALGITGGVGAFGCMYLIVSLAMSIIATIFVCYCEHPMSVYAAQPEVFNNLTQSWHEAINLDGGQRWYAVGEGGRTELEPGAQIPAGHAVALTPVPDNYRDRQAMGQA